MSGKAELYTVASLGILIAMMALTLVIYLFKNRKQFPYSNMSPFWVITFLISLIIHQILWGVTDLIKNEHVPPDPEEEYHHWSRVSNMLFLNNIYIHYIILWPMVGRFYYISKSLEYNFFFLSKAVEGTYHHYENNLKKLTNIFTTERESYMSKIVFLPFFILCIFLCSLYFYGVLTESFTINCVMYCFSSLSVVFKYYYLQDCQMISDTTFLSLQILKIVSDSMVVLVMIYFFYKICFKYKITKDTFSIRLEITVIFLIWLFGDNTYHGLEVFGFFSSQDYETSNIVLVTHIMDLFMGASWIILYFWLTFFVRKKIDQKEFYSLLNHYEIFMQNPILFNYFMNYVKKYQEEAKCLIFWKTFHFYKQNFHHETKENNIASANLIYEQYFNPFTDNEHFPLESHSERDRKNKSFLGIQIEEIEEAARLKFNIQYDELFDIFDSVFKMVNNRFYDRYLEMLTTQEDQLKILISYIQFDFSSDQKTSRESEDNYFN